MLYSFFSGDNFSKRKIDFSLVSFKPFVPYIFFIYSCICMYDINVIGSYYYGGPKKEKKNGYLNRCVADH